MICLMIVGTCELARNRCKGAAEIRVGKWTGAPCGFKQDLKHYNIPESCKSLDTDRFSIIPI